jgi:anti-sigma B factor antagonist
VPFPESLDPLGVLRGRAEYRDDRIAYFVSGELDLAAADALRDRLAVLAGERPGDLHLDFTELEFLGSTGIRTLIETQRMLSADGRRLVLSNVSGMPRRALELTETLEVLNVE